MSRLSILHNSTQVWGVTLDLVSIGSITGSGNIGALLTCNPPSYTSDGNPVSPTFSYQWYAAGVMISGATANTYTSIAADETKLITCTTTASYQGKSDTQTATGPIIVAGGSMPVKPAANLSTAGAITVTSGFNLQSQINANPNGAVFYFPNGTYTGVHNIKPKQGNRFIGQSEAGVIIQGVTSQDIAFRTSNNNITWARMTFQGYANKGPDISQFVGVIDLQDDGNGIEYVAGWPRANQAEDCHIDQVTIKDCGNVGIRLATRTNITDCSFYELSPHAIGGGFGTGGMIHSNYFEDCGTSGAPGAGANNAQIKIVWWNIGPWGDTSKDMTPHYAFGGTPPSDSTPETLKVVNNTFDGINNPAAVRGLWFDLDVRDTEVCFNTFQNHNGAGIFYEGCNGGWVHDNTFDNCGNLGAINFPSNGGAGFNTTFASKYMSYAAMTTGASDNVLVEDNTFNNCEVGLLFFNGARYKAPSDWVASAYPVIDDGRMAMGYGPLSTGDRSNGGSSNCTARNNDFLGTTEHFGFWTLAAVSEPGAHNESTFSFTGNTYPAGANSFVFNRTFQNYATWQGNGRQ